VDDDPCDWPTDAVGAALRAGKFSVVELVQAQLERIAARDGDLHHFTLVTAERAMAEARRADDELRTGHDRGPLHGIPYGVKDVLDVVGLATTCNSRLRLDHRAAADSAIVARMAAAGAVLVGKLATSEFACGGADDTAPFPVARNPWDTRRYTGGSSSGAAGAIAAGTLRIAIGSDTGGSIRVPASYCGVVGMKPSRARAPTAGLFPLAPSLDHVGPLGRTVAEVALMLEEITADRDIEGLRLGYARALMIEAGVSVELIAAIDACVVDLGAHVDEIVLPDFERVRACYRTLLEFEAYALHAQTLHARPESYGRDTHQRLMAGAKWTVDDHARESAYRDTLRVEVDNLLRTHDAIILSTALGEAPLLPAPRGPGSPTLLASLTGHPALSLPIALSRAGLPLGAQIIGRAGEDAGVLRIAHALESAIDFERRSRKPLPA
jgi:aspartyl-tRNA(Asn)/glutamyl-tRNA(Gln) amidotransferase subunit A